MKKLLFFSISYLLSIIFVHAEVNYKVMLENTCKAYEAMRTPNGFYLDSFFQDKNRQKSNFRVSSASTGIGLISLCIAEESGFGQENAEKSLQTLKLLNGKGKVILERNKNGLFKHFFNSQNGKSYGSEFSTIDTALLISGALFCKNTFRDNKLIAAEVKELWNSVNWQSCRISQTAYWLAQDQNGKGIGQTRMFNEYLLLADFCFDETPIDVSELKIRAEVEGYKVLSDLDFRPLPLFTFQFPLYLSPIRTKDSGFIKEAMKAAEADKAWWVKESKLTYAWGSSAGQALRGYGVNASKDNPEMIINYPSVAGMLPFNKNYFEDSALILQNHPKVMFKTKEWQVPWRVSVKHKSWQAPAIQGIDLAPLLFGLAALEENLGFKFFADSSQVKFD